MDKRNGLLRAELRTPTSVNSNAVVGVLESPAWDASSMGWGLPSCHPRHHPSCGHVLCSCSVLTIPPVAPSVIVRAAVLLGRGGGGQGEREEGEEDADTEKDRANPGEAHHGVSYATGDGVGIGVERS